MAFWPEKRTINTSRTEKSVVVHWHGLTNSLLDFSKGLFDSSINVNNKGKEMRKCGES